MQTMQQGSFIFLLNKMTSLLVEMIIILVHYVGITYMELELTKITSGAK
jgi:hypothetical protein